MTRNMVGQFQQVIDGAGIDLLKTPVEAPRANAFCERFLGSLRRECLDYMLILSEQHLRRIVNEYVRYYNHARPHQGLHQRIPCDPPLPVQMGGEIGWYADPGWPTSRLSAESSLNVDR